MDGEQSASASASAGRSQVSAVAAFLIGALCAACAALAVFARSRRAIKADRPERVEALEDRIAKIRTEARDPIPPEMESAERERLKARLAAVQKKLRDRE
jgi:hypothetical protein